MKKLLLLLALLFLTLKGFQLKKGSEDFSKIAKTGDLIFQTQVGWMSPLAIQVATLSPYSHVGVVAVEGKEVYVYEASAKVQKVKIQNFINRVDTGSRFVIYRHKSVDARRSRKVISYAKASLGKNYDTHLSWSNSRMYCSELVYKAYKYAGYDLESERKIGNMKFALLVSNLIPHIYENNKFNMSDKVVAPSHLSRDRNFEKVFQNW